MTHNVLYLCSSDKESAADFDSLPSPALFIAHGIRADVCLESMEQVTVTIPEKVAAAIRGDSAEPLERRALELFAIGAYETNTITGRQVMELLGFESREELYEFFKSNDVKNDYTIEDLEADSAALAALLDRK